MGENQLKISTLRKHLDGLTKAELIAEIVELFTKYSVVKDYYFAALAPQGIAQLSVSFKDIIKHEFLPERGFGKARLSIARKAVLDFKKICSDKVFLGDMMLYYVEMGVKFTNTYGDIDEPFYSSMESMYQNAVELITKHQLQPMFQKRCYQIVADTRDIGWGFHDILSETYDQHFSPVDILHPPEGRGF
jgi:hypothetical protein